MTVTDQIKLLNRKITQNEAQYNIDRKAAKISALPSSNLDKCEYLTGEDLGLKPSTVQQAKCEYSRLGKIFDKGLDEEGDKKEGLLKRLKNIEDKNEQLLQTTKSKTENIKQVTDFIEEHLSPETKALIEEIRTIQKDVDYRKLKIRGGNNSRNDFSDYKTFKELFRDLYYKKMRINDVEYIQDEFNSNLGALSNYTPKAQKYIEAKNKLLDNIKNFQKGTEKIIEGFKNGIFPLKSDDKFEEEEKDSEKESEKESDQSISNRVKVSEEILNSIKQIINKNKDLRTTTDNKRYTLKDVNDSVDKIAKKNIGKNKAIYFCNNLMNKAKQISELRFTLNRQKMLEIFNYLGEIFNGSKTDDEQPDTTDMSELENEESAAEQPHTTDMSELGSEESTAEQRRDKEEKGLKILTPNQMLSRLPIYLFRSKKLTKQIYKSLIDII